MRHNLAVETAPGEPAAGRPLGRLEHNGARMNTDAGQPYPIRNHRPGAGCTPSIYLASKVISTGSPSMAASTTLALSPVSAVSAETALPLLLAELRLMFNGMPRWWFVVALGLIGAGLLVPATVAWQIRFCC
jgi:hypothetical protein